MCLPCITIVEVIVIIIIIYAVATEPSRRFRYFAATEPSRVDGSLVITSSTPDGSVVAVKYRNRLDGSVATSY